MPLDFLISILKNTLNSSVHIRFLANETCRPLKVIRRQLLTLKKENLLTMINGQEVSLSNEQRLNLVVFSLKQGIDLETICRVLGWREFEDLVSLIFDYNGHRVRKHFRFKGCNRRYEIDVLGLQEPFLFSVECKHWKRYRRTALENAVRKQVERTTALIHYFPIPMDKLKISTWKKIMCLPVVVTLSKSSLSVFEGVPVVPIFRLNSFLNELQMYVDEIKVISIPESSI